MRRLYLFLLIIPATAIGSACQCALPPDSSPFYSTGYVCRFHESPASGTTAFNDPLDGFRFEYPAALQHTGLHFANGPCAAPLRLGENVDVEVSVVPAYQDPILPGDVEAGVQQQDDLLWHHYADHDLVEDCTWSEHEQVCIEARAAAWKAGLSPALIDAEQKIRSTLAFTGLPQRLDSRIAALKPGDQFCGLKVSRVITRQMAEENPKAYRAVFRTWGAVQFAGTITFHGSVDDDGTPNSGPIFDFYPDSDTAPLFPGQTLDRGIQFRNPSAFDREIDRLTAPPRPNLDDQGHFTVVVRNPVSTFRPMGDPSTVTGWLVSMTRTQR